MSDDENDSIIEAVALPPFREEHDIEPRTPRGSYQRLSMNAEEVTPTADPVAARKTLLNFVLMSFLFSANHGCVVACLALATSRLGSTGALQSGILYIAYTASALLGATYITKRAGARNALWLGMSLYCAYVGCFWVATLFQRLEYQRLAAYVGAAIGGIGAGFLWTAQGSYFGQASEEHAQWLQQPVSISTSYFAGIFAFLYLAEEVMFRLLSSILAGVASWETIFGVYTIVTLLSTMAMPILRNYPSSDDSETANNVGNVSTFYKVTVALQLLWKDPKMKYMVRATFCPLDGMCQLACKKLSLSQIDLPLFF